VQSYKLSVAFSIVKYTTSISKSPLSNGLSNGVINDPLPINRAGLCTSYLEHALSPWLKPTSSSSSNSSSSSVRAYKIRIFHKTSITFKVIIYISITISYLYIYHFQDNYLYIYHYILSYLISNLYI
jgi:hypothetical protein